MGTNLKEAIRKLADTDEEIYSVVAKVLEVDQNKRTCKVQPINDPEDILFGVRLQASPELTGGVLVLPKKDSTVVVTFLNKQTGYVALMTEVESFEVAIEQVTVKADKDGLLLSSGNDTLGGIWLDLISSLRNFKLMTNSGVTISPTPDTMANLTSLETKIQNLLKIH